MARKVIKIDEEKCVGCGLCANACQEGAIGIVNGKAKLLKEDYCDGLGNCLPTCPTGAISLEEREAAPFDKEAAIKHKESKKVKQENQGSSCSCAGKAVHSISRSATTHQTTPATQSNLTQWPIQIKLVPSGASYLEGAKLLVAADCCAYAYANFNAEFMRNKVTLIGCPKLDSVDYSKKLGEIIKNNNIKSLTIVRMEVNCCSGLENAAKQALFASGKMIPWQIVTISTDGRILED